MAPPRLSLGGSAAAQQWLDERRRRDEDVTRTSSDGTTRTRVTRRAAAARRRRAAAAARQTGGVRGSRTGWWIIARRLPSTMLIQCNRHAHLQTTYTDKRCLCTLVQRTATTACWPCAAGGGGSRRHAHHCGRRKTKIENRGSRGCGDLCNNARRSAGACPRATQRPALRLQGSAFFRQPPRGGCMVLVSGGSAWRCGCGAGGA